LHAVGRTRNFAFLLLRLLMLGSPSQILDHACAEEHIVQLYGDDEGVLARNVSRYLCEGLARGAGLIVIASRNHACAFTSQMGSDGADPIGAIRDGRFLILDAAETLHRFMINDTPDWDRFESVIGGAIAGLQAHTSSPNIRAYGEMVALLWQDGKRDAALRLEEFWNRLLARSRVALFCSYPIDLFGTADGVGVEDVISAHTHVVGHQEPLTAALRSAMTDVLGADARLAEQLIARSSATRTTVPEAEVIGLWLRQHRADKAEKVFERARHYERSYIGSGRASPMPG
jgi:DcmR-like sensory protein